MPFGLAARATLNDPTAVSAAPDPSVRVNVTVVPTTLTDETQPPEGTPASVQGDVPAVYAASSSSNTSAIRSTLPLPFVSIICMDSRPGGWASTTSSAAASERIVTHGLVV